MLISKKRLNCDKNMVESYTIVVIWVPTTVVMMICTWEAIGCHHFLEEVESRFGMSFYNNYPSHEKLLRMCIKGTTP